MTSLSGWRNIVVWFSRNTIHRIALVWQVECLWFELGLIQRNTRKLERGQKEKNSYLSLGFLCVTQTEGEDLNLTVLFTSVYFNWRQAHFDLDSTPSSLFSVFSCRYFCHIYTKVTLKGPNITSNQWVSLLLPPPSFKCFLHYIFLILCTVHTNSLVLLVICFYIDLLFYFNSIIWQHVYA